MKTLKISFTALTSLLLLSACQQQSPVRLSAQSLAQPQISAQTTDLLASYYPVEPGRTWTFALEQRQNGELKTKFRSMQMRAEALPNEGPVVQSVLRRSYPDSTTVPKPTLVRRYSDRVELSHYQESVVAAFGLEQDQSLGEGAEYRYVTVLRSPFDAAKPWEGRIFQGGTETIRVVGPESVDTPAGRFETIKVEHHKQYSNGKEDFLYYWYAPDVGMVKLYEELTFFYGKWIKFESTGVLNQWTKPQP